MIKKPMTIKLMMGAWLFGSAAPAFAYIDPGSGSLLLQMLIAGVIGFFFRFRAYVHSVLLRIKQWFKH
jgi:hypothetical protein